MLQDQNTQYELRRQRSLKKHTFSDLWGKITFLSCNTLALFLAKFSRLLTYLTNYIRPEKTWHHLQLSKS